jgi:exo-beta-1,3-glucanase (GH17 family)
MAAVLDAEPALRSRMDVIGVHAYGADAGEALSELAAFADRMAEVGLGDIPISWNELGWPTDGSELGIPLISDETRARYLREIAESDLRACGVVSLAPHTWVSFEEDEGDTEDWFGIADPETARPYESALAYREAIASKQRPAQRPCA